MEKYKSLIVYLLIVFASGCTTVKNDQKAVSAVPKNAIKVTVLDSRELDGCEYLLVMEDGKRLQPTNLESTFKKNGITLFITYKIVDGMSICMSGSMVELIFVQEHKEK